MGKLNPDKIINGQPEIASHYHPLLGPYDSSDPDLIQCHTELMKISGIDGVVIDWYGIEDHFNYATNHRNTCLMIEAIKKAKMKFAICYEDRTIKSLVAGKKIKAGQEVAHGQKVFQWMEKNWFNDVSYLKVDGKPAVLVFGPLEFKQQQWKAITSELKSKPVVFGLPHLAKHTDGNAFGWPPVSGGEEATRQAWTNYLDDLDRRAEEGSSTIAPVFAQYHDYYGQAGRHGSYGSLAGNDGETFDITLSRAMQSKAKFVQIVTWNDFDLRLPVDLYLARKSASKMAKELKPNQGQLSKLKKQFARVSELLIQRNCEQARTELNEANSLLAERPDQPANVK